MSFSIFAVCVVYALSSREHQPHAAWQGRSHKLSENIPFFVVAGVRASGASLNHFAFQDTFILLTSLAGVCYVLQRFDYR